MQERRRAYRFPLTLPLEARWRDDAGEIHETATTRDLSSAGLYFAVKGSLHPGSKVECDIRLPVESGPGRSMLLRCKGSVVRVEDTKADPQNIGLGVRLERYTLLRCADAEEDQTIQAP